MVAPQRDSACLALALELPLLEGDPLPVAAGAARLRRAVRRDRDDKPAVQLGLRFQQPPEEGPAGVLDAPAAPHQAHDIQVFNGDSVVTTDQPGHDLAEE